MTVARPPPPVPWWVPYASKGEAQNSAFSPRNYFRRKIIKIIVKTKSPEIEKNEFIRVVVNDDGKTIIVKIGEVER